MTSLPPWISSRFRRCCHDSMARGGGSNQPCCGLRPSLQAEEPTIQLPSSIRRRSPESQICLERSTRSGAWSTASASTSSCRLRNSPTQQELSVPFVSSSGKLVGLLGIRLPPATSTAGVPPLTAGSGDRPQLREATEYRYAVDVYGWDQVWLEPLELFRPDDESRRTGRLLTGQSVGWLDVELRSGPEGPPIAFAAL